MRGVRARRCKQLLHRTVKYQVGSAGIARGDLHVLPANPAAPSSLQCFEHRFFCCKTRGIMLRCNGAAAVAILALSGCENSLAKARRAPQHFANTCNFDNVYADGNDHKRC